MPKIAKNRPKLPKINKNAQSRAEKHNFGHKM